jgi:hypothetical protein
VSGATLHLTNGGLCTVTASQPGNVSFNAATNVVQAFTIARANQTISFAAIADKTFGDADFVANASSSSGLTLSFAASGSCTVSGATVHIAGAGSCTVTASQVGNGSFIGAPDVARTFAIGKANQTITFGALANKTLGAADFNVTASASSGLAISFAASGSCTVSGTTVHLTGTGTCTLAASQAGNANVNAATTVSQSFSITKVAPPKCRVPNVVGKSLKAAKLALKQHHCGTGKVSSAYSKKTKKGKVSAQSKGAGRVLPAGTKVNLVVSRGRKP